MADCLTGGTSRYDGASLSADKRNVDTAWCYVIVHVATLESQSPTPQGKQEPCAPVTSPDGTHAHGDHHRSTIFFSQDNKPVTNNHPIQNKPAPAKGMLHIGCGLGFCMLLWSGGDHLFRPSPPHGQVDRGSHMVSIPPLAYSGPCRHMLV